jgi:two-component system, NtrC family, sensor kinase
MGEFVVPIETDPSPATETADTLLDRAWVRLRSDPERLPEILEQVERLAADSDERISACCRVIRSRIALDEANLADALQQAETALSLLEETPDDRWRMRALLISANAASGLDQVDLAFDRASTAMAAAVMLDDNPNIAACHELLGQAQERRGEPAIALEHYRAALATRDLIGDRSGVATNWRSIGRVQHHTGFYDDAIESHRKSMEISLEVDDRAGIAYALNNIARVDDSRGDYPAALENYRKCHEILQELGELANIAIVLTNIGVIYNSLGDYTAALDHFVRSLALARELGAEERIASALDSIGQVHMGMEEFETAITYFGEALRLREQIGREDRMGISMGNLANAYARRGDMATASELHHRVLAIWERVGDQPMVAAALNNIGHVMLLEKQHAEAIEFIRSSFDISETIGNRHGMVEALANLGDAEHALGNHEAALEDYTRALAIALEIDALPLASSRHKDLATLYESIGEFEQSLLHLKEYHRMKEQLAGEEARMRLRTFESQRQIDLAHKEAEIERLRAGELADALRQLRQAQAQLVHAGKMAGLGQLTAGVAHEINNPINFVLSALPPLSRDIDELIGIATAIGSADHAGDPGAELATLRQMIDDREIAATIEEIPALLSSIRSGAERTAEIVRSLRSFSRLDEDELKRVDLHEGIDATIALLGPRLGDRIDMIRRFGPLPTVECRPGQINQVFLHILSNAIDAIEGNGVITIETREEKDGATIIISDNGEGIAPENLERIFEPFFTTRDVGGGQGLGLAISYGIIEKHGGTIGVESTHGIGTEVTITIPVDGVNAGR